MLGSAAELAVACRGTALAEREVFEVTTPAGELVLATPCTLAEAGELWAAALDLLPVTGRYPVVTYDDEYLDRPELFFKRTAMPAAPSAAAAIARAVDTHCEGLRDPVSEDDVRRELSNTQRVLGIAPDLTEVTAALVGNPDDLALERWLFDWEVAHGSATNQRVLDQSSGSLLSSEIPGFSHYLLLLPTSNAWQAPGYINYMGAESRLAEFSGAICRWEDTYDARLALIGIVTAEFAVGRPPSTPEEAWQLALEHKTFGGSNQAGLRWLAAGLMTAGSWWLFERP